jgi:glycosyltransferase involved in cell wall biosynthesis
LRTLVIILAYNEEKNLPQLLKRLKDEYSQYDYVIVNDASTDSTRDVCRELGFDVIDLPTNLGIGGAFQTGLKYAYYKGYDVALQFDGDGQHSPEDIGLMVSAINNGYNACIGSRFINNEGFQSTFLRRIGITFYSGLIRVLTGYNCSDPISGLKAFDKEAIRYLVKYYPSDYPEPEYIILLKNNHFNITEVPVVMNERCEGQSSITFIKSIYFMVKGTIAVLAATLRKRDRVGLNG